MIHGYGEQKIFRKSYHLKRCQALLDRYRFTDEELEYLEISPSQGGGRTNPNKFRIRTPSGDYVYIYELGGFA